MKQDYIIPQEFKDRFTAIGVSQEHIDAYEEGVAGSALFGEPVEKLVEIKEATELRIKLAEEAKSLAVSIMTLTNSELYIDVIESAYFEEEKNRLANLLASDAPMEPSQRNDIADQLTAMGRLRRFLLIKTEPLYDESAESDAIRSDIDLHMLTFAIEQKGK